MAEERCVCCDEIIPKGRVCEKCEQRILKVGSILQSNKATEEEVKNAYDSMRKKDEV
jgi:hypothetical protein